MKKNIAIASVMAFMLVLSACGGSGTETGNTGNEEGTSSGGSDVQAAPDNTLEIEATNFNFGQDSFKVKAGEPVTINLTSKEGMHGLAIDEFDVDISGEGTAEFTPEEPGEYTIYCSIPCGEGHSDMKSTLIVE